MIKILCSTKHAGQLVPMFATDGLRLHEHNGSVPLHLILQPTRLSTKSTTVA